jgi:hypothetical protein
VRVQNLTVFDEYIPAGAAMPIYTSSEFHTTLGAHDAIGVQVVIDNVSATGGNFDMIVEHSADGVFWIQKNTASKVGTGPWGEISYAPSGSGTTPLSNSATNIAYWSDACVGISKSTPAITIAAGPLLGFVRLALTLTIVGAHVRIHATLRDH